MRLLPLAFIAVFLLFAVPASADRRCESDHPVYALKTFNGPGCGTALVVASRITNRFNGSGDFSGQRSTVRITQRDGNNASGSATGKPPTRATRSSTGPATGAIA